MGKLDNVETGVPTLLLQLQNSQDVQQAIRILKGEEALGDIQCIQL